MRKDILTLFESNQEKLTDPFIQELLKFIEHQAVIIEKLEAEIKRLKKRPPKPPIKPSTLEKDVASDSSSDVDNNPGALKKKRSKKAKLEIDKLEKVKVPEVEADWEFKGYKRVIIQELKIERENTLYLLEAWRTPEGKYIYAQLPECLQGSDFGPMLKSYILYQYNNCHVTQPLLLEQLWEFGVDISSGQLSRLLTENQEAFHQEKEELLSLGLRIFPFIQSDDTGARHRGKNGYCTVVSNDFFTYFKSTPGKSRINFLELLCGEGKSFHINEMALEYMHAQGLAEQYLSKFAGDTQQVLKDQGAWEGYLEQLGIRARHAVRIATEGALIGCLFSQGINKELAVISDDAGQFNVLRHGLCWIHAERNLQKLHCYSKEQEEQLKEVLTKFWCLYQDLKLYQKQPHESQKQILRKRFDRICNSESEWLALKQALQRLAANKEELLLVLEIPEIPLHNNTSERDIREYVKRRKVSGSTRSESGKKARDTFASLKKTCRKLGISFWDYLNDRIAKTNNIKPLAEVMVQSFKTQTVSKQTA
jgi:hypothetical protein